MAKNTFLFSSVVGDCAILPEGNHTGRIASISQVDENRIQVVFSVNGNNYSQNLFIHAAEGKNMSQATFFGQQIQQATGIFNVDEAIAHAMENDIPVVAEYRNGFVNINPGSRIEVANPTVPMPKPATAPKKVKKASTSELDEVF